MRDLTELDGRELRVLGGLMEKEQATPDYYPLTLKALVAACNQKTNRDPVFTMSEIDVLNTLRVLQQEGLVERVTGARVDRWEHKADARIHFKPDLKAVLTLLMLRGPQTPGELRARSDRLHPFEGISEVEEALQALAQEDLPLARPLPRRPGQKETRWSLAVAGEAVDWEPAPAAGIEAVSEADQALHDRVARLEEQVAELAHQVKMLDERIGPSD